MSHCTQWILSPWSAYLILLDKFGEKNRFTKGMKLKNELTDFSTNSFKAISITCCQSLASLFSKKQQAWIVCTIGLSLYISIKVSLPLFVYPWSSLDKGESLACQITSPFNN